MDFQEQAPPEGEYTFVLIPSSVSDPLVEYTAPLACGLEDERVQKTAKLHFFGESPEMLQMVDICTVYLPSRSNGYIGVSLYSHADSALPVNSRATAIAQACGHIKTIIYGDAFISRCYDNEEEPWVRRDLHKSEVSSDAAWVVEASQSNKGRNMDAYTSGGAAGKAVHQMMGSGAGGALGASGATASAESPTEGGTDLVKWTQTNEDIEIKIPVPPEATAKSMNIKIKANSVSVSCPYMAIPTEAKDEAEKVLVPGGCTLYGSVHPDECTWSLDGPVGAKYLTITLEKTSSKIKWPRLTKKEE